MCEWSRRCIVGEMVYKWRCDQAAMTPTHNTMMTNRHVHPVLHHSLSRLYVLIHPPIFITKATMEGKFPISQSLHARGELSLAATSDQLPRQSPLRQAAPQTKCGWISHWILTRWLWLILDSRIVSCFAHVTEGASLIGCLLRADDIWCDLAHCVDDNGRAVSYSTRAPLETKRYRPTVTH